MKPILLVLAIPAAIILTGCSSNEPEYTASGDETTTPVTTSLDAARALNLDMTPATSDVVRATIVEPSSTPAVTSNPTGSALFTQTCRESTTYFDGLRTMAEQLGEDFDIAEATKGLLELTKSGDEVVSEADRKQIESAIHAAANGEC